MCLTSELWVLGREGRGLLGQLLLDGVQLIIEHCVHVNGLLVKGATYRLKGGSYSRHSQTHYYGWVGHSSFGAPDILIFYEIKANLSPFGKKTRTIFMLGKYSNILSAGDAE